MKDKKKYYIFEMNMKVLNIFVFVILFIVLGITYLLIDCDLVLEIDYIVLFLFYIPWMLLHEILHSIAYVLHGAKFKNITYGANLEKGILCCLCKQNISKKNILISLICPLIFIGILTYIIGIVFDLKVLLALSILNICGCAGDIAMFFALSRIKNFEFSEYDNPLGFGLYTSEDLSKRKMFGLKFIKTETELKKEDYKKIRISKTSIVFFLIIVVGAILRFL